MIAAFILGLTPIPQALFETYGEVDVDRVNAAYYAKDSGFRIAYFIEAFFFLSIILLNYHKIPYRAKDIVLLNMALVFCAILLIFIRSENGGRLSWMYMIGIIITLTSICINNKTIIREGVLLIFISLYLYIRVYNGWQLYMNLYPYKTFLTNGYREGDPVRDRYEYDFKYEENKFYR